MNKVNSYIGFAKKSGSILFGENSVLMGDAKLIVYSNAISKNFISKISKTNIDKICLNEQTFLQLNINAKVFAITNAELSKAIYTELKSIGGNNFDNK